MRHRAPAVLAAGLRLAVPLVLAAQPLLAVAAMGPWEQAVGVMRTFFTGVFAQGIALIAVILGGAMFALDDGGGSKKKVGALVFGTGLMLMAAQFLNWMFGAGTI